MENGSRLIQVQNATIRTLRSTQSVGGVGCISKTDTERALRLPKAVFGPTIVLRSLKVKSHIEYRSYVKD